MTGARAGGWRSAGLALAVALLAVAPRVGPALACYQPSHDAAEHLLLARSLAAGEGFALPIRVRDVAGGPAVHAAFAERAPLYPLLLAAPVAAGVGATGWPDPRLQLLGVALAAAAAALAARLGLALARARGLPPGAALRAALAAGVLVGWGPSLVRASIHLWAEPLGLALVLGALALDLAAGAAAASAPAPAGAAAGAPAGAGARGRLALTLAAAGLAALARFARPEAWVVGLLVLGRAAGRGRREGLAAALAVAAVNVVGVAATGVLAPQLELLRVVRFEDALGAAAPPPAPSAAQVLAGVASNLAGQLEHLLLPKNAWLALPAALLALAPVRRRAAGAGPAGALLLGALGLTLATALVWSTRDPHRFTIAPLACLAPVAAVEAEALAARLGRARGRAVRALWLVGLALVLGWAARREQRGRPPAPPPTVAALEGGAVGARDGALVTDDPWSYALLTGRPAVLAAR